MKIQTNAEWQKASSSVVAWRRRGRGDIRKGHKHALGVIDMLIILNIVMMAGACACVKAYWSVHLKYLSLYVHDRSILNN